MQARADFFADERIVRRIKEECIPVIWGFYNESKIYSDTGLDEFFKRLSDSAGTPGRPFYMPNGTPFFCTASGILLRNGLDDWKELPASERLPGAVIVPAPKVNPEARRRWEHVVRPPPKTLILCVYHRALKKDEGGRLYAPKTFFYWPSYNAKLPSEPNRDFMWLLEREWRAMLFRCPRPGDSVIVPAAVCDRICFWHLAPAYDGLPGCYKPDDFRSRQMRLVVQQATPETVVAHLPGFATLLNGVTYRFFGVLQYNLAKQSFERFDLLALWDEGAEYITESHGYTRPRYYGVAFELPGERTGDLLPPLYIRQLGGSPERYLSNQSR